MMLKKCFRISKDLYPEVYIIKALEAFSDFSLEWKNNELSIEGEDESAIAVLFWEFMNYVLWLLSQDV